MALHPDFPDSPHAILDPSIRWFPADEVLRATGMDKLMPPLVAALRLKVKEFRDGGYVGATDTSKSLLNWWFNTPHLLPQADGNMAEFQYFFAQREVLETIIYLYDVVGAKDKFDLMRFDSSGAVSASMFDETWRRYVVKMATGAGKTKVLSLALAWSYFNKTYEPGSELARNFLLIAPNIIVLDRIYKDFQGLKLFFEDPVIPDNGFDGRNWHDDFQLTLHLQDEVRVTQSTGNIFLTNIHRVYAGEDIPPTPDDEDTMDFFLGKRPKGATTDSKVDLGTIVRDIDELMVLNDEAHHIHDARLAWFKSIEDIHNRLVQKGSGLALQVDVTATPKHNNGAIFVQTVADYPLVEAISQNVVKHPVLPDAASRSKLSERQSAKYTEKYADYLDLGVIEWRKAYDEHQKLGKKAILFVMTDDTKNCDDVAAYLEGTYPDLKDAVLVIHTKSNGEISEASTGKGKDELELLRKQANEIDDPTTPYKAVVSVLMLKEGWDVRNVTTIVGLRAYSAKSNILPEQTLGRGLRKMYPGGVEEYLSVVGTDAFMEFVESIQAEGVELERKPMGAGTKPKTPIVVEIDKDDPNKDLDALDIEIPVLTPRIYREYKNLADLDVSAFGHQIVAYQSFSEEEQREIVFKDITTGEVTHTTVLDTAGIADFRSVLGYFTKSIMDDLRLVSGYDVLYGKVKAFVQEYLFGRSVELDSPNTLRNLSELAATKTLLESFKKAINALTVKDRGDAEIKDTIKLRKTRPFVVKDQGYVVPKKSVFNKVIGDSHLELVFANFLEGCADVVSYAKNYFAVHFKIDYVNADGSISNYYPDFIVKLKDGRVFIVETKGLEDLDVPLKMNRLRQWCEDINAAQSDRVYDFVYVDEASFEKFKPMNFAQLVDGFREYK
ncbi:DEAD/DEAH box helicase family protein [Sulfitobacter sp. KE34]|uniref:DEAD/DEAH box helicase family protein n=1 Tax=unclassified Sulfitobacter TaxID=196795 RepID=UPI0023E21AAD|nr:MULTISPECIES: DEAD/DEAH box helicase family protein [unclassified Sulfitobacter]MDF3351603.1 DEAD/DEAH box helicase family protein [Sulfitobacter sp. KE12]MDF3355276.1 DEAD/DEAH box helicase family protein [Sulfitobacter sp. KE27]MDF3358924.1 DEAD/DEAH box helicase family protein [Sulfitobacter sp. KE33]MDF3366348.1 DEAD/DEAH box helicase family protein [Sulfitobacter sp. Ks34]MDF3369957.1 DEAD/DEAH box helicase family protein [Sulfitobacter sp. Ks43]